MTLHLLSSPPARWPTVLPALLACWQHGDRILLVAEAYMGLPQLCSAEELTGSVSILEADAQVYGQLPSIEGITIEHWSYSDWAEAVVNATKVIHW